MSKRTWSMQPTLSSIIQASPSDHNINGFKLISQWCNQDVQNAVVFHIHEHFTYMNRAGSQGVRISDGPLYFYCLPQWCSGCILYKEWDYACTLLLYRSMHMHILADHATHSLAIEEYRQLPCSFFLEGLLEKTPNIESPPSVNYPWMISTPKSCSSRISWSPVVSLYFDLILPCHTISNSLLQYSLLHLLSNSVSYFCNKKVQRWKERWLLSLRSNSFRWPLGRKSLTHTHRQQ